MKQFSLATTLLCAALAPLCADNVDNMISAQNNGNGNNGSGSQMSNQNQNQKRKMEAQRQFEQRWRDNQITPEANPKTLGGSWNPIITADFIYWKSYQQGLAYAYNGVPNAPSAVPPSAGHGKVFRPKFEWEPGFKVGLGNKFAHDGWDVYAEFTWLHSDAEDNGETTTSCCEVQCSGAKSDYWFATNVCPEAIMANCLDSKWNLNRFYVLDLEMGRDFYVSKYLTLRPFGGLKFSWMKQHYDVDYNNVLFVGDQGLPGIDNPLEVIPLASDVFLDFNQKQFGVGLRVGMDTAWYFCKWLGVYGDLALTGLWNRFNEKRETTVVATQGTWDLEHIRDKVFDVTGVLEIGLGLFFDWTWHNDDYRFILSAGWETQVWFNQNNFIYLMNSNAPGNLSFQGFTLEAGFGF